MTNEEINKLIAELEKLKTPEQEGIVIPECSWMFDVDGNTRPTNKAKACVQYGYKRTTEEAVKLAAKRMIRTNRLSLLAHILGVEKEFVSGEDNYYLLQPTGTEDAGWSHACHKYTYCPDRVYMTKEGAESIAVILNNGEFDLELR